MQKPLNFLGAVALGLTLALPATAQEADVNTVVATVNGTDITLGHMIAARARLPQQYAQLPPNVLYDGLLDQLTQQTLLSQSMDEVPNRVAITLENERRSLLAGEVITAATEGAASQEALQDAYNARFADAEPETEYSAAHILVETEEEAAEIKTMIEDGGDFAELAREKSTGPSGPNGGDLGWFGKGMMVKPFEDAVVALEAGAVSDPVQTQFGWHIVKLNETRLKDAPAFESVRAELQSELEQAAVQARIDELEAAAEITKAETGAIDPAVLTNYDLLNQ
ncbi:peptidylprolyl isomerase [Nereida sp. MMG025]|uniref:peptidylprolyl isomerase n=1 Tax=Nereida sp. MMG025 TaxID=2909981 RepID=UPI001F3977F7|nr:peptidylprolyl isomerase [Nereida sp. MMG025]MCF6444568.1 peptidylprolyl isomerase [Nereida sp. MMG025]